MKTATHLSFIGQLLKAESNVAVNGDFTGLKVPRRGAKSGHVSVTFDLFEIEARTEPTICDHTGQIIKETCWYYRLTEEHPWVLGGTSRKKTICKALIDRVEYEHNGVLH